MKKLHMITYVLVILGGLSLGLEGIFDWSLVEGILGTGGVTRAVYALIGVSTIVELVGHKSGCKSCGVDGHSHSSAPESTPGQQM